MARIPIPFRGRARKRGAVLTITHTPPAAVWGPPPEKAGPLTTQNTVCKGSVLCCPDQAGNTRTGFSIRVEAVRRMGLKLSITGNRDVRSYDPDKVHWQKEKSTFYLPYGEELVLHRDNPDIAEYWTLRAQRIVK